MPPRNLGRTTTPYLPVAIAGTALAALILTLVGACAEARLPHPAGRYISLRLLGAQSASEIIWQLRRVDGVQDAAVVLRGSLSPEDMKGTGWGVAQFYAYQTDVPRLAFLPPDPTLRLLTGQRPDIYSLDQALVGYELAQALRLEVGDQVTVQQRPFTVSGIWSPSGHLPGNFVQISALAVQALAPTSDLGSELIVLPDQGIDPGRTALRIWEKVPDLEVVSPQWELARAKHEQTIMLLSLSVAALLCVLLCTPLLRDLHLQGQFPAAPVAALAGILGSLLAWAIMHLANLYAARTLALTPLQMSLRCTLAPVALTALCGLIATRGGARSPWRVRYTISAMVLAVCGTSFVTLGTLQQSLGLSAASAQQAAADWVTVPGVPADAALLRDMERVPAVRGYAIEALGGLANEDEERWIGPHAPSGTVYGVHFREGEGTLTVPYHTGYWQGGPLAPEERGEAVIGYALAQARGLSVGDLIALRDVPFSVVGIRAAQPHDPTGDADFRIDISMEGLRRLLLDPSLEGELTLLIPQATSQEDKLFYLQEAAARLNVDELLSVEERLEEIARSYPGTWTVTPATPPKGLLHAKAVYSGAMAILGVLTLAAGGLAVTGAITERLARDRLRVSLLKALGTDEGQLLGDYMQLAALIGCVGALPGIFCGWLVANALNRVAPDQTVRLLFTPQLGAAAFLLIAITAMAAALGPISHSIRQGAVSHLFAAASTPNAVSSPELEESPG